MFELLEYLKKWLFYFKILFVYWWIKVFWLLMCKCFCCWLMCIWFCWFCCKVILINIWKLLIVGLLFWRFLSNFWWCFILWYLWIVNRVNWLFGSIVFWNIWCCFFFVSIVLLVVWWDYIVGKNIFSGWLYCWLYWVIVRIFLLLCNRMKGNICELF